MKKIILTLILLINLHILHSQENVVISVLEFEGINLNSVDFNELIISGLQKRNTNNSLLILSREEVFRNLNSNSYPKTNSPSQIIGIGKKTKSDYVISGNYDKSTSTANISMTEIEGGDISTTRVPGVNPTSKATAAVTIVVAIFALLEDKVIAKKRERETCWNLFNRDPWYKECKNNSGDKLCCKPKIKASITTCQEKQENIRDKIREAHFNSSCTIKNMRTEFLTIWNQSGKGRKRKRRRRDAWDNNSDFVKWFGKHPKKLPMKHMKRVNRRLRKLEKWLTKGKVKYIVDHSLTTYCDKSKEAYHSFSPFSRKLSICTGWFDSSSYPKGYNCPNYVAIPMNEYIAGTIIHELNHEWSGHKGANGYCPALEYAKSNSKKKLRKARKNPWNYDGLATEFYCSEPVPNCN